ncbi:class I histocompatibility antigen, F10 alpha chain-like isoform X3 [Brachyhypopomus gauderio]|uniref:class I histocompatibility antigen, F10 alpha chain-like isoform X3 n=1 Tax=Brachyhypopomus gauderio TaxID=698409 RepID=UPI0040417548
MGRAPLCVFMLFGLLLPVLSEKHSLYYIYTALSKPLSLPGVYEFTAMGLLDDREIDYFNSQNQEKVPMQDWMKEKMQADYWVKGTDSRRSKQQWFKVNVDILMERMRHNKSDLHVLQWRHGCEVEDIGGVKFLKGMDLYSYDGEDFLSFDSSRSQWIAPVRAAEATKKKWDDVPILNQYTKGYLEKECVDWLTRFMEYGRESLRNHSKPDVYAFAKKCVSDSSKLTLTCLATGFYPKDVKMSVRKYRTSLPENMLMSLGVRPNDDETYQLRKSVEILENEQADYDCYVDHISLKEPVIVKWDGRCNDCSTEKIQSGVIGGVIGALLVAAIVGAGLVIYKKRREKRGNESNATSPSDTPPDNSNDPSPSNSSEHIKMMPDSSSDSGHPTSSSEETSKSSTENCTEMNPMLNQTDRSN